MDTAKIGKKQKTTKKKARTSKKTKSPRKVSSNQKIVEIPGPLRKEGKEYVAGSRSLGAGIDQEEMPSGIEDHVGSGGNPESEGLEAPAEDIIEVLAFRLSGKDYAFRVTEVEEILNEQKITYVPRVEPFLFGIASVRGKILPVLDIERRFSLAGGLKTEGKPKMVVLKGPKGPMGVVLCGVMDIKVLQEKDITSPPAHIEIDGASFIEGTVTVGDRLISIIRTAEMLDFQESKERP